MPVSGNTYKNSSAFSLEIHITTQIPQIIKTRNNYTYSEIRRIRFHERARQHDDSGVGQDVEEFQRVLARVLGGHVVANVILSKNNINIIFYKG